LRGNGRRLGVSGVVPIPDELRKDSESTRYTEEDGVEVHFLEAVVVEEDTGVSVDVGVWVLDFAEFAEDAWGESVHLRDEFEQFIVREMFQREFTTLSASRPEGGQGCGWGGAGIPLSHVSRIGLAKDGVSVTWDNTTTLQS
jgi:hypothetical protein